MNIDRNIECLIKNEPARIKLHPVLYRIVRWKWFLVKNQDVLINKTVTHLTTTEESRRKYRQMYNDE